MLDEWVEANEATWTPTTLRDQSSRAALIAEDQIAVLPVARLTVADVERWHLRVRRAGLGEGTIRNRRTVLRAALTQTVRWGWMSSNVATMARLRSVKRAPCGAMTVEDVRAVLVPARDVNAAAELALRIAAVTGARRAEIAALRWSGLDADRLTIDSSAIVQKLDGERVPVDVPTKTASRRTVRLDAPTVELFDAQRLLLELISPYAFSLDLGPANPDRIGWWWHRARELSGIDKKWRLDDLRHWAATVAIGSGADVRTVAGRLRHAECGRNPAMTLRVESPAFEAADQALATTMGNLLDPQGREDST